MRRASAAGAAIVLIAVAACRGGPEPVVTPPTTVTTITVTPTTVTPTTVITTAPAANLEWTPLLTDLGLREPTAVTWRTIFETGFEQDGDLAGFYVTPQSPMTRHEVVAGGERHGGARAHHGWLTGEVGDEPVDGPNHRGYPAIQLQSRPCTSPCLVDAWVRLDDAVMGPGEWVSFATFTTDPSNRWTRVITVNIGTEGWLHLFHVPTQGVAERAYQRTDLPYPLGQWVRVTTLLDVDPAGGAAAVWQDGVLVSAARVDDGDGDIDQMHFGLYAPPTMAQASVWNDDIVVRTGSGDDAAGA